MPGAEVEISIHDLNGRKISDRQEAVTTRLDKRKRLESDKASRSITGRQMLPGLLGFAWVLTFSASMCGAAAGPDWKVYRNAPTGLTFRYPPSMHVVEDDPRRPPLLPTDAIVLLMKDHREFLRLVVNHGNDRFTSIGDNCKPIRLGGQEAAFECVNCIPACLWSVEVVTPRSCTINAGLQQRLKDGDEPLRTIVETVRFEDTAVTVILAHRQRIEIDW